MIILAYVLAFVPAACYPVDTATADYMLAEMFAEFVLLYSVIIIGTICSRRRIFSRRIVNR